MTSPANQQKLEIVDALAQVADEAGISLIELAIAFAMNHPGVTSAIIGRARWGNSNRNCLPRTCG